MGKHVNKRKLKHENTALFYLSPSKKNKISMYTNHPFFSESVYSSFRNGVLVFKKPTIDYKGKLHVMWKKGERAYEIVFYDTNIPIGEFEFDEDSNEDEMIIDTNTYT